jgi:hypothetical protein
MENRLHALLGHSCLLGIRDGTLPLKSALPLEGRGAETAICGRFAPSHYGYQRPCDLISGPASNGTAGGCAPGTQSNPLTVEHHVQERFRGFRL